MSKCERKVVRKFALETEKLMHSLYPMDKSNIAAQGPKAPPRWWEKKSARELARKKLMA
jgi:hypothetical protein